MKRDDWFINEYEKEMKKEDKKLQQRQIQQVIQELEYMYQAYLKKNQEIETFSNKQDKEKIQQEITYQQQLLEKKWKQVKQYQQQPQNEIVIQQVLWDTMRLAKNQQMIDNTIWQIKMKETQIQFQQMQQQWQQKMTAEKEKMTKQNPNGNTSSDDAGKKTIVQANGVATTTAHSTITSLSEKFKEFQVELKEQENELVNQQQLVQQQQAINDTFAFVNPESYTQYSRDLKANKSHQLQEKENLKDEKNANELISVKFSGDEDDVSKAAIKFMYAIQKEAESLIERNVFSEPSFVKHVIYKCLSGTALAQFYETRGSDILPLTPKRVSEIIHWIIEHWNLSNYIESVKKEFEQFNPSNLEWLQIIPTFRKKLRLYQITATACGIQGQYQVQFSDQYLVTTLKNKLPIKLQKAMNDIRWEAANKSTTSNVFKEPEKLQLPEPKNLQELHNLIVHTKRKKDFNKEQ